MKFSTDKNKLLEAVTIASHLATVRSTLPILQNLFLETRKDQLLVKSTDLDQTLEILIDGEVVEDGALTVPARLIVEYLNNNPDSGITIASDDLNLSIQSSNHQAKIKGLAAEEYPTQPNLKTQVSTNLPLADLRLAITKTIFASAQDETRPILNSLLWRFKAKELTLVGTDGYRLAYQTIETTAAIEGDYILPKRVLQELIKLPGEGEVAVAFAGNQVRFSFGAITLTSRLLDGAFPAYEAIIPRKREVEVVVATAQLVKSLKLASLFSRDSAFSTKLALEGETMTITAVSPQIGENSNQLKLSSIISSPLTVSLNAHYLIEGLNALEGEAKLGFIDAKSPIVVEAIKDKNYLYLLMPLRSE